MKYLWLPTILILMSIATDTRAGERRGAEDEVLFERPIGEAGQRLVVTRGPDRDPAIFKSLRTSLPELRENFYEVRVELRSPNHDPVLLAARLRVEDGTLPDKGLVVLDVLIEPRNIVLAVAEGADLTLWQVGIGGESFWTWLLANADKRWTPLAAASRLSEQTVAMALGRTNDGRLTVEVIDKRVGQHTVYEEAEKGSRRFNVVREWTDKGQK